MIFKIPKHKKRSTARKKKVKCGQTRKKVKTQNENRISSSIFTSGPHFSNLTPRFSNFMKIRKEGTKSKEGTGLDAGPGRTLQKTFLYGVLPYRSICKGLLSICCLLNHATYSFSCQSTK
jgi:hypothetical protein